MQTCLSEKCKETVADKTTATQKKYMATEVPRGRAAQETVL